MGIFDSISESLGGVPGIIGTVATLAQDIFGREQRSRGPAAGTTPVFFPQPGQLPFPVPPARVVTPPSIDPRPILSSAQPIPPSPGGMRMAGFGALPGGAPAGFARALGPLGGAVIGGVAGEVLGSMFGGNGGAGMVSQPFRQTACGGVRAQTHALMNPCSGNLTWFRPAGRPILWSSDLAAAKRVSKVARRARGRR